MKVKERLYIQIKINIMDFEPLVIDFNSYNQLSEEIAEESYSQEIDYQMHHDMFGGPYDLESILLAAPSSQENTLETNVSVARKDSKKSIHHNFQKHTVTTLKKVVSIHPLYRVRTASADLAIRMWGLFMESKEKTKEILSVIYGSYSSSDLEMVRRFKANGFEQITESPEHLIRSAQEQLRNMTAEQLSSVRLDKHLDKRRMAHKESFRLYLKCFCQELLEGHLRQRLGKSKARSIQAVLDTDRFLSL